MQQFNNNLNDIDITFLDKTGNWSLWFDGKILKTAKKRQTLVDFASKRWGVNL